MRKGPVLDTAKPMLPATKAAAEAVEGWAASQPRFASALKSGVPTVRALTGWGLDLLKANQITEGIGVLRAAVALSPNEAMLWANYGTALGQGNFWVEATAALEYAVTLTRQQPTTWLMLGMARKKLGKLGAAETACRRALEQDPASGAAWQLIGAMREEQKDFDGAIECMEACIRLDGASAVLLANLGRLQYQFGDFAESCAAYTKAAALDPGNAHFRQMAGKTTFLQAVLREKAIDEAVINHRRICAEEGPFSDAELMGLLQSSFSILSGFGHVEPAARVARKLIGLWPENPSFTYLLSAVAGDQTVDRSPPEYVVAHFDAFAEGFDAQLVGALDYDIPEKICAAISSITVDGNIYDTLDAGCGTGLCGPLLRPLSRRLTGVDLSSKMLEQAGRKQVYDVLACEELMAYLGRSRDGFDLIVAADLMIYFGDLTALFRAAAAALKPRGFFAFSTELWKGEGYKLLPSGRFSHSPKYVRGLAERAFAEVRHFETTIRLEANRRLAGDVFVWRRRDTAGGSSPG